LAGVDLVSYRVVELLWLCDGGDHRAFRRPPLPISCKEVIPMLDRRALLVVVVLAVSVALFAFFNRTTGAQERGMTKFARVEVVTYASGLTGFFDRDTGTLYVYDASWDKCMAVRRVNTLGSPMTDLRKPRN
jgi:hypothetical protein